MKKIIQFLLSVGIILTLSTERCFAQMQGLINSSSERIAAIGQPIDRTVKVKHWEENKIITLYKDNPAAGNFFALTDINNPNNVLYAHLPTQFKIYDFSIFKDKLYFCGTVTYPNNTVMGFICWVRAKDLFDNPSITLNINHINAAKVVYKISAYQNLSTGSTQIGALGTNYNDYFFINYTENAPSYELYQTPNDIILTDIAETKNYIAVLGDIPNNNTSFCLFRHDKININNTTGQIYHYPAGFNPYSGEYMSSLYPNEKRKSIIMTEKDKNNSDEVFIAHILDGYNTPTFSHNGYKPYIHNINIDNLHPLQSYLFDAVNKDFVVDMKFNPTYNTICLLGNGSYITTHGFGDYLLEYKWGNTIANTIITNNGINTYDNFNNSIDFYDHYDYLIIGGKEQATGQTYWFDKKIGNNLLSPCFKTDVKHILNQPVYPYLQIHYSTVISQQKNITNSNFTIFSQPYITTCQY